MLVKNFTSNINQSNQIAFEGKIPKSFIAAAAGFSILTAAGIGINKSTLDLQDRIKLYQKANSQNEEKIAKSNWGENVKVLAAAGQNTRAITDDDAFSYTVNLNKKLNQNNINTIEEANKALAEEGYGNFYKKYYSLSSPNSDLNIFNKNDKGKNRFVLALSDGDMFADAKFRERSELSTDTYKKIFNIPDENVIQTSISGRYAKKDFEDLVDEILNKIKNKTNVEILIQYNGRGYAENGLEHVEGAKEGFLLNNANSAFDLRESEIKRIIKEKFKNGEKVIIIMDSTSGAGAWISKAEKVFKKLSYIA